MGVEGAQAPLAARTRRRVAEADLDHHVPARGPVVGHVQGRPNQAAVGDHQALQAQHGQHRLVGPAQLGHGERLGSPVQVEQPVELLGDVGQLGHAVAADVVVAAEDLGLETIGDALVALGLLHEATDAPGPAGAGQRGGVGLPGVPEGRVGQQRHVGQAPVTELGDEQGPAGPLPLGRGPLQLVQVVPMEAAVPVGGQDGRDEDPVGVGIDPVVLHDGPGRVLVCHRAGHRPHEVLVARPTAGLVTPLADLVHGRPEHDAGVVAVPSHLLAGGGHAAAGQLRVAPHLLVGQGLGDGDVAVQEHAELVTHVEVHRIERLDVQAQGVEPHRPGGRHLVLDLGPARLGVELAGSEALDQRAPHPVGLTVDDQAPAFHAHGPQPVAHATGVAQLAAGPQVDQGVVQVGLLGSPPERVGRAEADLEGGGGPGGQVDLELAHQAEGPHPESGRRRPAPVLDLDPDHEVVGVAVDEHPGDHPRAVAAQGHGLPDPSVGQVQAGTAGEDLVGPALLAVGHAQVAGVAERGVLDPHGQLVVEGQRRAGVDLEGGEGLVVAAEVPPVEVHRGQVHHRAEAQGPLPRGVGEAEAPPVPGGPVEVEVALGLPQPRHADGCGDEPVEVGQVVVAREEVPHAVEGRRAGVVEGQGRARHPLQLSPSAGAGPGAQPPPSARAPSPRGIHTVSGWPERTWSTNSTPCMAEWSMLPIS